jgi:hypothetical protein
LFSKGLDFFSVILSEKNSLVVNLVHNFQNIDQRVIVINYSKHLKTLQVWFSNGTNHPNTGPFLATILFQLFEIWTKQSGVEMDIQKRDNFVVVQFSNGHSKTGRFLTVIIFFMSKRSRLVKNSKTGHKKTSGK